MAAAEYFAFGSWPHLVELAPPQPQRRSSNRNVNYRLPPARYPHSPPFPSPQLRSTTPQLQPPPPYSMISAYDDEQKLAIQLAPPPAKLSRRHSSSSQRPNTEQSNYPPARYNPQAYAYQQPPRAATHLRPNMIPQTLDDSLTGGYSSDQEHHRRRYRHEKREKRIIESSRSTADGFIGTAGGGLIGDLIFPGLGTVGGALVGWLGGKDHGSYRKQQEEKMDWAQKEWDRKYESRDHSTDGRRRSRDHSGERCRRNRPLSLENDENVPFVLPSHPSHDIQLESTPGSSRMVADELLQISQPVVSATKLAPDEASAQQDSITRRSPQACPSTSVWQSVTADNASALVHGNANSQVPDAVNETLPQIRSDIDPTVSSPSSSSRFNSDSPSEFSFVGAKETPGLETLFLEELRPSTVAFVEQLSTRILRTCINYSDASFSRQRGSSGGSSKSGSSNSSSQKSAEHSPPTKHTSL